MSRRIHSSKRLARLATALSCFTLGLTAGSQAAACQYEFAPEPIGGPSAQFLARKMYAAATFVDVAVAEGESDIRGPDGKVTPWAKGLSFRVLQRWKGTSTDRFLLFGSLAPQSTPEGGWSLTHWVDDEGRIYPYESVREAQVLPPVGMTSCDPPALTVKPGRTYVVLREADGRLLGAVQYHADMSPRRGTAIAEVGLWPDNDWARQLSYGQTAPAAGAAQPPSGPIDPTRATVRFRQPLPAAKVEQLLRASGAVPFAATLVRGGVSSDYRLDSKVAWHGLIADAAAWGAAARTSPSIVQSQARTVVDSYPVRDIANDGAKQTLARSVIALADAPKEDGPALVTSVGVVADANVQRALARLPDIADVVPAVVVRGRVATAPRVGTPAAHALPQIEAVDLHRRLTALAGRDVAPASIEGRWRMTGGDSTTFGQKVFVLELKGGRVTATMPCASASGTYRFAGQVLELDLPKPSLESCPKHQDYWYPGYLLENKDPLTVRPSGNRLDLIATGGTYHFVRD